MQDSHKSNSIQQFLSLQQFHVDKISYNEILDAIRSRNKHSLKEIIDNLKIDNNIKKDCIVAANFIGTFEELNNLPLSNIGKEALLNLKNIGSVIIKIYSDDEIIFDLSDPPKLKYYDGIIFKLYSKESGSVIASGGRYDLVYRKLGSNKKSVGFSYYLQQLEKILDIDNFRLEKTIEKIKIDKKNGETTFIKAIKEIKEGKNIEIIY